MVTAVDGSSVKAGHSHTFGFDRVLGPNASQEAVFHTVGKPVSEACLQGYNGAVFAYGQTGSGKTFTVMGECSDD